MCEKSEGERLNLAVFSGHWRVSGVKRAGAEFSSDPSLASFIKLQPLCLPLQK